MESFNNSSSSERPATAADVNAQRRPVVPASLRALGTWLASPAHLFMALLTLVPPIIVLLYVLSNGVNMPFWDEWGNSAIIAIKTANGTLSFADLARQNHDHRLFFSNLLTAIVTVISQWNLRLEMLVSFALALGSLGFLLATFRKHQSQALVFALIPFSALIFSLRHHTNLLWAQQSSWFFTIFFTTAAVWVIHTRPRTARTVILGSMMAFAATYSTLHGLSTWVAVVVVMVLSGYRNVRHYALVFGLAGLAILLYSLNYDFGNLGADENGNAAGLVRNPYNIVLYIIAYLGNPFVRTADSNALPASILGVAALLVFAINIIITWQRERTLRVIAPWVGLALWAVSVAFLTALGRSHVYPDLILRQPLLDRYVLPPTLLWIALIAVVIHNLHTLPKIRLATLSGSAATASLILCFTLVPLYLYASVDSFMLGPLLSDVRVECMLRFQATRNTACLAHTYIKQTPLPTLVERINDLATYRLSSFAGTTPLYTENIPLYSVQRAVTSGNDSNYRLYDPIETQEFFAYQQPTPGQTEFLVQLPATDAPVFFAGGVAWDVTAGNNQLNSAINFRVGVRTGDSAEVLQTITYDPATDSGIKPYRISLNDYRGQTIRLVLQTTSRDDLPTNLPLWIDPVVFVDAT